MERRIVELAAEKAAIEQSIPAAWEEARARYVGLADAQKKARRDYRQNVDEAYRTIADLRALIAGAEALRTFEPTLAGLGDAIANEPPDQAMDTIKAAERGLGAVAGSSRIKDHAVQGPSGVARQFPRIARRPAGFLAEARERHAEEVAWRTRAAGELLPGLSAYDDAIRHSVGLRVQERLTREQARLVAECQSVHRDISLHF